MTKPIPYIGSEPYIFVSYSHMDQENSNIVYPIIEHLQLDGFRVWYDEGIDPASEYANKISEHITGCGYFIAIVTENYIKSDFCLNEIDHARRKSKPLLLVYLVEPAELEKIENYGGFDLLYSRIQHVVKCSYSDEKEFWKKIHSAKFSKDGVIKCIDICRDNTDTAKNEEPETVTDEEKEYFQRALTDAERGNADSQITVGNYYFSGIYIEKDISKAMLWYRKAAEQGRPLAQRHLAWCLIEFGGDDEKKEAFELLTSAAEKKLPIAITELGNCFYDGIGTKKNIKKAVSLYKKAAELGDPKGMFCYGMCFYNGVGRELSLREAAKWLKSAAELGYPDALFVLSAMYSRGEGVPLDLDEAERLCRLAADNGNLEAKKVLKDFFGNK